MKRYYFDYAASTPVDSRVLRVMQPYFSEKFGNAGSLHSFGREAISAVDHAREIIAKELDADFRQIIFTSSATEANNFAIKGAFFAAKKYFEKAGIKGKPKVIVSSIEHESVLESARELFEHGAEVIYLPVNDEGSVSEAALSEKLDERTAVVSVMLGNNETGVIEPVEKLAKIVSEFKGDKPYPLFHSDTAQAFQYMKCEPARLGLDLMTISSQKIYGPKGAGALYVKNPKLIQPLVSGGAQEFGLRSGTENVPAIVGFGVAVELAARMRKDEAARVRKLREYFWDETKKAVRGVFVNGAGIKNKNTLPHAINIFLEGHQAEEILTRLDLAGFAVSTGSACRARSAEPSHVILAMGHREERARGSLRISFGRQTKKGDVDKLIKELKKQNDERKS